MPVSQSVKSRAGILRIHPSSHRKAGAPEEPRGGGTSGPVADHGRTDAPYSLSRTTLSPPQWVVEGTRKRLGYYCDRCPPCKPVSPLKFAGLEQAAFGKPENDGLVATKPARGPSPACIKMPNVSQIRSPRPWMPSGERPSCAMSSTRASRHSRPAIVVGMPSHGRRTIPPASSVQ